jgi:hypothetical protein
MAQDTWLETLLAEAVGVDGTSAEEN